MKYHGIIAACFKLKQGYYGLVYKERPTVSNGFPQPKRVLALLCMLKLCKAVCAQVCRGGFASSIMAMLSPSHWTTMDGT